MKKQTYQKPSMRVELLQHQTMLLSGSNKGYDVIGTDPPNTPAGVREYNSDIFRDDGDFWNE